MTFKILGYTVNIRQTIRPKKKGFTARPWTASEIDSMLRFRSEGKSTKDIAKLLKRTEASIYSRINKLQKQNTKKEV